MPEAIQYQKQKASQKFGDAVSCLKSC